MRWRKKFGSYGPSWASPCPVMRSVSPMTWFVVSPNRETRRRAQTKLGYAMRLPGSPLTTGPWTERAAVERRVAPIAFLSGRRSRRRLFHVCRPNGTPLVSRPPVSSSLDQRLPHKRSLNCLSLWERRPLVPAGTPIAKLSGLPGCSYKMFSRPRLTPPRSWSLPRSLRLRRPSRRPLPSERA